MPDRPALFFDFNNVQEVTENLQKWGSEQKKPSFLLEKRMCDLEKTYSFKAHNYDNAELGGSQLQNQKKMNKILQKFLRASEKTFARKKT